MRCEEIMKREVHCAFPSDTVQKAAQIMRDQNVGFLPVCELSRKVEGALTDRDICIRVDAEGRSARECKVADVMTREVVACRPWDDVAEAERLMATHHKSRMLITDDQGIVLGVISLSDIAERDTLRRAAVTLREVSSRETHA